MIYSTVYSRYNNVVQLFFLGIRDLQKYLCLGLARVASLKNNPRLDVCHSQAMRHVYSLQCVRSYTSIPNNTDRRKV